MVSFLWLFLLSEKYRVKGKKVPKCCYLVARRGRRYFFTLFIVSWLFLAISPEIPYFGDVVLTVSVITNLMRFARERDMQL